MENILRTLKKICGLLIIVAFITTPSAYAKEIKLAKININNTTEVELVNLKGIGAKTARAIVAYRTEHHNFKSIDEIKNVKGIGEKKFEAIKDSITVDNPAEK